MKVTAVVSSSAETNIVPRANSSPSIVVVVVVVLDSDSVDIVVESFKPLWRLFTSASSPPHPGDN